MTTATLTDTQIYAEVSHYGHYWFCHTSLALKGRGIAKLDWTDARGLSVYKVTDAAFERLSAEYNVRKECSL